MLAPHVPRGPVRNRQARRLASDCRAVRPALRGRPEMGVSPLCGPGPAVPRPRQMSETLKNDINLMAALVNKLPEIETTDPAELPDTGKRNSPAPIGLRGRPSGHCTSCCCHWIRDKNGGTLARFLRREGDSWLCEMHARRYR